MSKPGMCRVCCCTDEIPCLVVGAMACTWVEPDLCSACAPVRQVIASEHALYWLYATLGVLQALSMANMPAEVLAQSDLVVKSRALFIPE